MSASSELVSYVARHLSLKTHQVQAVMELLDDGSTVPFIARYRKERTGELDEVQIRDVQHALAKKKELEDRRIAILKSLESQGIQDSALISDVQGADTLTRLEDLYAPYRPRRVTRAQKAIEAGLEPIADQVVRDDARALKNLEHYICDAYPDVKAVRKGVVDIFAERIADDAEVRELLRQKLKKFGTLLSKKKRGAEEDPKYALYIDFASGLSRLRPHQVLAMRRGEKEGALSLKIEGEQERWLADLKRRRVRSRDKAHRDLLEDAIDESYKRLLLPQLDREFRGQLEGSADAHAISIFSLNLKNLLLRPPLPGKRVLGLDPGLRTGCKLAVVGPQGEVLHTDTVYVHDGRADGASRTIAKLLKRFDIKLIAIGNGTGTHQTQEVTARALEELDDEEVRYAVVDEAGASVYSASDLARAELPDLDVSLRGAASIARRLQDPLAELVKIDPKSVGVGMYQHDVDQNALASTLDAVVEDVVNSVGVDLNSASPALLSRVSGIGQKLADRIVDLRKEEGAFIDRTQLKRVKGLGAKTFEQCAGFLRIRDGKQSLDNTGIHPESYALAKAMHRKLDASNPEELRQQIGRGELDALATTHGVGRPTLLDVYDGLTRPGRDPRAELDPPDLRKALLTMKDLYEGMTLSGTVRNVVDFGAFVDIGVKQDGLVHISKMSRERVHNPYEVLSVGERVEVTIMEIDTKRGRISLSMVG